MSDAILSSVKHGFTMHFFFARSKPICSHLFNSWINFLLNLIFAVFGEFNFGSYQSHVTHGLCGIMDVMSYTAKWISIKYDAPSQ
jgi:hypothetical protein